MTKKPKSELGTAFKQLADSLQQLADSLAELSARTGDPIYRRYQKPFGDSVTARKIWIRYGQYTTRN